MIDQNINGLIVEPTKSNLLNPNLNYYLNISEKEVPLIIINTTDEELKLPYIDIYDTKTGKIATKYLIEMEHTKIGLLTKEDDIQGRKRMKGYAEVLGNAKLTLESNNMFKYNNEIKSKIPTYLKSLIESGDYPTAFVTYNDDSHYSKTLPSVQLTSIKHPKEQLGRAAVRWPIDVIESDKSEKESIIFESEVVIRNSTRKIVK